VVPGPTPPPPPHLLPHPPSMYLFILEYIYSPNKRSFRGPGGFVRGLDSLGGQNLCMGTGPCGPPRGPPTTLVLGGHQKAVHPQLCPRGPPHGPHGPHGPRGPRGLPWLDFGAMRGP